MSSKSTSIPPEENTQYQVLKEGGYNHMQGFMHLGMHNDDDVQEAKEILGRFEEYDRAHADGKTGETDTESDSSSDSDSSSKSCVEHGAVAEYDEDDEDNEDDSDGETSYPVEGEYAHFEWGLDEPEFEGYPARSDSEQEYDFHHGDHHDEPADEDYGDCNDDGDDW
ncbi:hypothetical protein BDW59DRAFT_162063 [Aspergillus cavernicola]|uniref:Uncharacterized protein n=1 Tax=Aspergillus cavernicola TaxID=176166 RepID=A0ABR4IB57_9EURO